MNNNIYKNEQNLSNGFTHISGDYKYIYNKGINGWRIRVVDKTKQTYEEIPEYMWEIPVLDMSHTFADCFELTQSPVIPNSVKYMRGTFEYCLELKEPPEIPDSVENVEDTFAFCIKMTKAPALPDTIINMCGTYYCCYNLVFSPDVPNTEKRNFTFCGCGKLTKLPKTRKNPKKAID